jgi:hypothetical protein
MWAVTIIVAAPRTHLGAIPNRDMAVTINIKLFPQNNETDSCPFCSSHMAVLCYDTVISRLQCPNVLQYHQLVSGTSLAGCVTTDTWNLDFDKSTVFSALMAVSNSGSVHSVGYTTDK